MSDSAPLCAPAEPPAQAVEALLAWFAQRQRDLPWRRTRDPYRIWVSEVMLQQTQVRTVEPYYERFLARFPTVEALAEADLDQVLAVWQGLGYYSRARNLHAAARLVRDRHHGQVPADRAAFSALPGVGAYTAAAVLSIAFGQELAAIDGNVKRVLCRLCDYDQDPNGAEGQRTLRAFAEALLPSGRAGAFNQAMMELGATVCLPKKPLCNACPLQRDCRALARGVQEERPLRRPRPVAPHRLWLAAYVCRGLRLLLLRRQPYGLLGGLWELPNIEIATGEGPHSALQRLLAALKVQGEAGEQLATVRHAYTHYSLTVHVLACSLRGEPQPAAPWDDARWASAEARDMLGLTGVTTKILARTPWPAESLAQAAPGGGL